MHGELLFNDSKCLPLRLFYLPALSVWFLASPSVNYFKEDGTIFHPHSGLCLSAYRTPEGRPNVQMKTCDALDKNQIWKFEK